MYLCSYNILFVSMTSGFLPIALSTTKCSEVCSLNKFSIDFMDTIHVNLHTAQLPALIEVDL